MTTRIDFQMPYIVVGKYCPTDVNPDDAPGPWQAFGPFDDKDAALDWIQNSTEGCWYPNASIMELHTPVLA